MAARAQAPCACSPVAQATTKSSADGNGEGQREGAVWEGVNCDDIAPAWIIKGLW